jgi:alcohol dehydrogenase class IV
VSEQTKTWLGAGVVSRLREAIDAAGSTSVVLVTGGKSYIGSGAKEAIEPQLEDLNVEHVSGFAPNPRVEDVDAGLAALERAAAKGTPTIIGVGGGSAMDMAKLIAAGASQPKPLREMLRGKEKLVGTNAQFILIPTTAGTGSEATHFATVYDGTQKYSVAHQTLLPGWALVDPDLCASLPAAITASTGVDAMCQGIESLWAVNSTEASRAEARAAIKLAVEHLEAAVTAPTPAARLAMCEAANRAGKAINTSKTTACHALSYGLTIRWDVPHGQAVATSLGEMLVFNAAVDEDSCIDPRGVEHVRGVMAEIVELLGASDPEGARANFDALMARVGLEGKLSKLGAGAADDRSWLASTVNLERLGNNPRRMSGADLEALLARIAD